MNKSIVFFTLFFSYTLVAMEREVPSLVNIAADKLAQKLETETAAKLRPFVRGYQATKAGPVPIKGNLAGGLYDQIKDLPSELIVPVVLRLICNANNYDKEEKRSFIKALQESGKLEVFDTQMITMVDEQLLFPMPAQGPVSLVTVINNQGDIFLHNLAKKGNAEVLSFLQHYGIKIEPQLVNTEDAQGNTPLHVAAANGKKAMAVKLISLGAILDKQNDNGDTSLILFLKKANFGVVYPKPANKNEKDRQWADRVSRILEGDGLEADSELVTILLGSDKDQAKKIVNIFNARGQRPLMFAASHHKAKIVEMLLDAGADVNPHKIDGNTALHLAAQGARSKIIYILVTKGKADVNVINNKNATPLGVFENNVGKLTQAMETSRKVKFSCDSTRSFLEQGLYLDVDIMMQQQ